MAYNGLSNVPAPPALPADVGLLASLPTGWLVDDFGMRMPQPAVITAALADGRLIAVGHELADGNLVVLDGQRLPAGLTAGGLYEVKDADCGEGTFRLFADGRPAVPLSSGWGLAMVADLSGGQAGQVRYPVSGAPPVEWERGFQYLPEHMCGDDLAVQDPCATNFGVSPTAPATVQHMPYLAWAGDRCSTFGWAAHDFKGRATRGLLAVESFQIARELWHGTRAQASDWPNKWLAHATTTDKLTSGPVSTANALAILEKGIADLGKGQRGMIHCTPELGSAFSELGNTLRVPTSGQVVTYRNTLIVADAGYDGTGPHGEAAQQGSQWAYGTLMVQVRRGPITVWPDTWHEATDRAANTVDWRAWRPAAATWPCGAVAVEVDLPLPLTGGAS